MIATLAKTFTFDAAHCLPELPADHKCARLHGHTYEVELVMRGQVQPNGFVIDYADIAAMWQTIHDRVDHRYLNEVPGLECPSTENLAAWMWITLQNMWSGALGSVYKHATGCFALLQSIRIKESSTTWCVVTREDVVNGGVIRHEFRPLYGDPTTCDHCRKSRLDESHERE